MGQLNGGIVNAEVPGLFAALDSSDATVAQDYLTMRKMVLPVAAGVATLNTAIASIGQQYTVRSVRFCNGGTPLTASDTNYVTVTVAKNDGAGGARTTVATATTKTSGSGGTGNWAADTKIPLTVLTASSANVVAAGSVLYFQVAQSGSGVTVACALEVELVPSSSV